MSFLFGKNKKNQASAEVLEDGRARASAEMEKPRYRDYAGKEPLIDIRVRVQPQSGPPFEAVMKAPLTLSYLLLPGVLVNVAYTAGKNSDVRLDDAQADILARNPRLIRNG